MALNEQYFSTDSELSIQLRASIITYMSTANTRKMLA